jgi:hypothetical protein
MDWSLQTPLVYYACHSGFKQNQFKTIGSAWTVTGLSAPSFSIPSSGSNSIHLVLTSFSTMQRYRD